MSRATKEYLQSLSIGDKVSIYWSSYASDETYSGTVKRFTKTMIIVDVWNNNQDRFIEQRYNRKSGLATGYGDTWSWQYIGKPDGDKRLDDTLTVS